MPETKQLLTSAKVKFALRLKVYTNSDLNNTESTKYRLLTAATELDY